MYIFIFTISSSFFRYLGRIISRKYLIDWRIYASKNRQSEKFDFGSMNFWSQGGLKEAGQKLVSFYGNICMEWQRV